VQCGKSNGSGVTITARWFTTINVSLTIFDWSADALLERRKVRFRATSALLHP
jgi:hypothetical protein